MKRLTAAALLLGLLLNAASAFATPITFDVVGQLNPNNRAQVTADYASGLATFTIQNTSTSPGYITGFAFDVPGYPGITTLSGSGSNPGFTLSNPQSPAPVVPGMPPAPPFGVPGFLVAYVPDSVHLAGLPGHSFDAGMSAYGPGQGIQIGQIAIFSLIFTGGPGNVDTSAILAALAQEPGPHFAVEFSPFDVGTPTAPTPLPAAVWLLGSGLVGLLGYKRSRKDA